MTDKPQVWAAFLQYHHTDIDLTFKRAPGEYKQQGVEEQGSQLIVERPGRRPRSSPPRQDVWQDSERQLGPKLGCRPANGNIDKFTASLACDMWKCTSFEGRPVSALGIGQFSPQSGSHANEVSRITADGELWSRGVMDIDQTSRRKESAGHRAKGTTFDKDWDFSEEKAAELQKSIECFRDVERQCSQVVRTLDELGIECRRLKSASADNTCLQMRLLQQKHFEVDQGSKPTEVVETRSEEVDTKGIKHALQKPILPCRQPLSRKTTQARPQASNKKEAQMPGFLSQASRMNINTRRMQLLYSTNTKQPAKCPSKGPSGVGAKVNTKVAKERMLPICEVDGSDHSTVPKLDLHNLATLLTNPSLLAARQKTASGSVCSTQGPEDNWCDDSDESSTGDNDWVPLMAPRLTVDSVM